MRLISTLNTASVATLYLGLTILFFSLSPPALAGDVTVDKVTVNESLILSEGAQWDVSEGLILHLKLNDDAANTTIADASGSAFSCTLNGGNSTEDLSVSGRVDKAQSLDGSADWINADAAASTFDPDNPWTVTYWFAGGRDGVNEEYVSIANSGSGLPMVEVRPAGADNWIALSVRNNAGVLRQAGIVQDIRNDSLWHMLSAVFDGTNYVLYVDGAYADQNTQGAVNDFTLNTITIGARRQGSSTPSVFAQAKMDDVRIYNAALSANQISGLYNVGLGTEATSGTSASATVTTLIRADAGVRFPELGDITMGSYTNEP